jgi:hypothetical protein
VVPAFLLKLDHDAKDPAARREWVWLLLTPFAGGLPVLLVPALLVAGGLLLIGPRVPRLPAWPAAAGAVLAAILLAPVALRGYGRWAEELLHPQRSRWARSRLGAWIARAWRVTWTGAGLAGLSLLAFGGLLLNLLAVVLTWGGLLPRVCLLTRPLTQRYRRGADRWADADLPSPYRPYPSPPVPDQDGRYQVGRSLHRDLPSAVRAQRPRWVLGDPATRRDQLWSLGAPVLGPLTSVPAVLVGVGFFGLVWQVLTWVL